MKNLKINFLALSVLLISSVSCSAAAAQEKIIPANAAAKIAFEIIKRFPNGDILLSGKIYKEDCSEYEEDGYHYRINNPTIYAKFKAFVDQIAPYVKSEDVSVKVTKEANPNRLTLHKTGLAPLTITKEQIIKMLDPE